MSTYLPRRLCEDCALLAAKIADRPTITAYHDRAQHLGKRVAA